MMDEDSNLTEPDKDCNFDDVTDMQHTSKTADSEKEDDDAGNENNNGKTKI